MALNHEKFIERIDGKLHSFNIIKDDQGKTIHHHVKALKVEVTTTDILQILVGASMLAIPSALTEEVWTMGREISWFNALLMLLIEYIIIGLFIYFEAYQQHMKIYRSAFIKRILATLIFSALIIGIFLALVGKLPLFSDTDVAIKTIIIGMLPASMSATVLDSLK